MGRDFGKMRPRATGRFLEGSGGSVRPYKIQKWLPKSRNSNLKILDFAVFFNITHLAPISHKGRIGGASRVEEQGGMQSILLPEPPRGKWETGRSAVHLSLEPRRLAAEEL